VDKETGLLNKYLGGDAKVIVETRFLGEARSRLSDNWYVLLGFESY